MQNSFPKLLLILLLQTNILLSHTQETFYWYEGVDKGDKNCPEDSASIPCRLSFTNGVPRVTFKDPEFEPDGFSGSYDWNAPSYTDAFCDMY